jgi:tripartite-type tricarboxylate transporter receptor subunit TctC
MKASIDAASGTQHRLCAAHAATLTATLAAALASTLASTAAAQDFYKGKTVTIIVGNPAGSGYDAYGRLLARHLPRHLPGQPNIIVQNMPGAGSVKAADYTYNIAPADGTAFTLAMPSTLVEPLTAPPGQYRYDPTRFAHIGTMDSGTRICVTSGKSTVKSIADARRTKAIIAATAPSSSAFQYPRFMNLLAGTKFDIVTGYKGPGDVFLAVDRGEADGACGFDVSTIQALRPDWLGKKTANLLVQFGREPSKQLLALGMPSHLDFIENPQDRKVVELIVTQQVFQRPFLAPPKTPPERVKVLRDAFMAAMRDPELLDEASRQKLELNPKSGAEVEALLQEIYAAPKELIARMQKVISPQ